MRKMVITKESVDEHLETPFEWGGNDKNVSFDCYGLIESLYKDNEISIPTLKTRPKSHQEFLQKFRAGITSQYWVTTKEKIGAIVVFQKGQNESDIHFGVITKIGFVTHACPDHGKVVTQRLGEVGRIVGFYEYRGKPDAVI